MAGKQAIVFFFNYGVEIRYLSLREEGDENIFSRTHERRSPRNLTTSSLVHPWQSFIQFLQLIAIQIPWNIEERLTEFMVKRRKRICRVVKVLLRK